jgi:hypothetical protein
MAAAIFDSRSNRARKSASSASSGGDLEGDLASQAGLLGEVDDAHPAAPDDGLDAIRAEVGADPGVGTLRGHGAMNRAFCSNQS